MVRKGELDDGPGIAERPYGLVQPHSDSMKLNSFINEWDKALLAGRKEFLKSIRTLDLANHANTQVFTLKVEGEPLGDYHVLQLHQEVWLR